MKPHPRAMLNEIAEVNPRLEAKLADNFVVSFLGMTEVSADGTTREGLDRAYSEVRKSYTPFRSGDILVAKITPCFENGKIAQAVTKQAIAFGSTEFHVIRPRFNIADPRFILHYLRQDSIRTRGERRMTGSAGQRRVPISFLEQLEVPLPSLSEQRRIAAILDQADALRSQRRAALAKSKQLTQASFVAMFGSPRSNQYQWTSQKVHEIADQVTDGEHLTPERSQSGVKLLSARNVRDGHLDFADVDYISPEVHERLKRRCNPSIGDILISCSGTIGRVAPVTIAEPLSLVRSVAMIRPRSNIIRTEFLTAYLQTPELRQVMLKNANSSAQANLFQGPLREIDVLVPPIGLQDAFAERLKAIESLQGIQSAAVAELEALFASLQYRAFRGGL